MLLFTFRLEWKNSKYLQPEENADKQKTHKSFQYFFSIIILFYYSIERFKPQDNCSKRKRRKMDVDGRQIVGCLVLPCFQGFLRDAILFDDVNNSSPSRNSITIECIDHRL